MIIFFRSMVGLLSRVITNKAVNTGSLLFSANVGQLLTSLEDEIEMIPLLRDLSRFDRISVRYRVARSLSLSSWDGIYIFCNFKVFLLYEK